MRSVRSATMRLLLVLAVVILAVYTIVQAINRPVTGDTETYHADFSDVFGLHRNADVRVRGVQVGKVTGIELQRSGVARVEFTVRTADRLTGADRLAIKFQNLVGQRYLAIDKGTAAAPIDPDAVIPVGVTTGSFDITKLFNGLRPILTGADPEVFNTFATNMLHLIQGEDGVGIGDVLADVDRLTKFAADKRTVIRVIVDNLAVVSAQLKGKSSIINTLMDSLGMLFDTLELRLDDLRGAFGQGAKVFPPIVDVMKASFDMSLGGHDDISRRLMELVPDTGELAKTLASLPTVLAGVNAAMGRAGFDDKCSHGQVDLPPMGSVLLGGGRLVLCKE